MRTVLPLPESRSVAATGLAATLAAAGVGAIADPVAALLATAGGLLATLVALRLVLTRR